LILELSENFVAEILNHFNLEKNKLKEHLPLNFISIELKQLLEGKH